MSTTTCASCERTATNTRRWSPVLRNGAVVGHTCPHCPRAGTSGEPIRRVVRAGGSVRFKVTLDLGDDASGRRRQESKSFTTLADARSYVRTRGAEIKRARLAGKSVTGRDLLTVEQLLDRWLASKSGEVRPVTLESYRYALLPVRRRLGDRRVQSLSYGDVLGLRAWLTAEGGRNGRPLGAKASKASLSCLSSALDHAVRVEGVIATNPAKGVRAPRAHRSEELERWTAEELMTFVGHADTDPRGAAWRLACLGLRREEVLGLGWDAVDFDAGIITIRRSRVAVSKDTDPLGWQLGDVKSKASRRTIRPDDVLPGTMAALRRMKLASVEDRKANPQGLVVVDDAGQPMLPRHFTARFRTLAAEAGVPVIKVHSTRHSVAYLLHDAGVPAVRAAAYLGHELHVHVSIYLFAREDDVQTAGAALGAVLAKAANSA